MTLTGDDAHERLKILFAEALALPPEQQDAFLASRQDLTPQDLEELRSLLDTANAHPMVREFPDPERPPDQLGRYPLERELGRGGMGIVYLGKDPTLNRQVAVKTLPRHLARDKRALSRLQQEAQHLASTNHPNVTTVHSLESDGDSAFLTMEYVPGPTLQDRLEERACSVEETISIGVQIARGLEAAHRNGVVHRDLKPQNVKVADDGTVKILDFGIAKAVLEHVASGEQTPPETGSGSSTMTGIVAGTPGYMSPEQRRREPVDARTDLWALGCLLFECLTRQRASDVPPDGAAWRGLKKRLAPEVLELIRRCLSEAPEDRPSTAAEVADGLERAAPAPPSRRRRLLQVGLVALAILVGLAMWRWIDPGPVVAVEWLDERTLRGLDAGGAVRWVTGLPEGSEGVGLPVPITIDRRIDRVFVITRSAESDPEILGVEPKWGHIERSEALEWGERPAGTRGFLDSRWMLQWPPDRPGLVIGVRDGIWYSFAVQQRDGSGDLRGTYYHPGPLEARNVDLDKDGAPSLLLWGANSSARFIRSVVPFETSYHCGCAVLLDPDDFHGQGFPYSRDLPEDRDWADVPPARERAYVLVPPLADGVHARASGVHIPRVEAPDHALELSLEDGRVLFLDAELRPVSCYVTIGTPADDLLRSGEGRFNPITYLRRGEAESVTVPVGAEWSGP